MTTKIVIFSAFLISCNGVSIGTVSEKKDNVKSDTNIGDLFPDWVPFKNKHGDELGDFVPVVTKNKVKKRLAPPVNFILRAVAEPDGDDYYDKGAGESDSEDNYESKDWSDLHRSAEPVDNNKILNHTDVSEIDGVVNILTRKPEHSIADAINNARRIKSELIQDESENEDNEKEEVTKSDETTEVPATDESQEEPKRGGNSEEDVDYDEGNSEKQKVDPVEDVSESEAKKAKILDSVDELKERHAQEARDISEKVKEEELYKEEFERYRVHPIEVKDKYGSRKKYKKITPDYDEYEDKNASLENKYRVNPLRVETTTITPRRTTRKEQVESGKLSVFKNPQLYMIDTESEETVTVQPKRGKQKFSARYTITAPTNNEEERISLVPEDSKEGEPTLFFPKKRKSRRRKSKTTPKTDSYEAETTENANKITASDTTASDTRVTDTTVETAPSATGSDVTGSGPSGPTAGDTTAADTSGSEVTNTEVVTDAQPASSDHKKEEKSKDYHNEKGGGREHHSENEEEHEEHGKKAYEGHHDNTKTAKGHHDKEDHLGKYDDHGGVDKHHSVESGHYGDHHHEEHGKKHAEYEESGKHSKGHNTKGSHDVHKKEEYEKKVEFFEEEGDSAEEEKHGGYNHQREHAEGGKFKNGKLKAGHEHQAKGESGHFDKGGHSHVHKGHKESGGHDSHGKHGQHHFSKHGKDAGKKWVYHHGFPAKTANLVVIDRRGDQYYHGPGYYG